MNKELLKNLLFFTAGFFVARYLIKKALPVVEDNTNTPVIDTVVADVTGIVSNVANWLKSNFGELSDSEAQSYAEQATGVTPETTGATGQVTNNNIAVYAEVPDNGGEQLPVMSTYAPLGYNQNADIFGSNIVSSSPDAYDMKMAVGNVVPARNKMGRVESDYRWSFN